MVKKLESIKKERLAEVNAEANVLPVVGEHNIESLLQEGIVVRLNIGRWRGKTSITEKDFDLNGSTDKLFRLGEKYLLPKDSITTLQAIEVRARRLLHKYGFRTPAGAFVPIKNLTALIGELSAIRAEYFEMRDSIMQRFYVLKQEVIGEYADWIRTNYGNDSARRERFLDELQKAIPEKSAVEGSFYFTIRQDIVVLPTVMGQIATAYMKNLQDDETRAVLQNVAREYEERVKEEMDLYKATIFDQLRSDVFDVIEDAISAVNMEGELPSGKVNKIKHLWEQVSRLNFFGDEDLQTQIDYINSLLSGKKGNRDSSVIKDKLVRLAELTKESAEKIKDLNSRGAFLEF